MIRTTVSYEGKFGLDLKKAYDLTSQWLNNQYKVRIKKNFPLQLIEAKQGTKITNTGHDPNWRKLIRISFYEIQENKVHIRIEASPLARTMFRTEKLRESWYNGLFIGLFNLLHDAQDTPIEQEISNDHQQDSKSSNDCQTCGKKIDQSMYYCTNCGIKLK